MGNEYKPFRVPRLRADGLIVLSDMYAAAYLLASNHAFRGCEVSQDGERGLYLFEPNGSFERDYAAFLANQTIGVRTFLDAVYVLKTAMREAQKAVIQPVF